MALPPFSWNNVDADLIESTCGTLIAQTDMLFNQIAQLGDEQLSFSTCIAPLMSPPNYKTNPLLCETKFLQHCSTDENIRNAAKLAGTMFAQYRIKTRLREDIYKKILKFSQSPAAQSLDDYQKHFLNAVLLDFKRSGLNLEPEKRNRLVSLMERDAELCSKYKFNISADSTSLEFTPEQLEGVSDSFIKSRLTERGTVLVTRKYPDLYPVMRSCNIAATRKALALSDQLAYGNNLDLMAEAVKIRHEIASLLGYAHYADYVTEKRMTGSAQVAWDFLNSFREKLIEPGKRELARLLELKREFVASRGEEFDGEIHSWDLTFYNELLMKKEYGVDEHQVKQYFPLDNVVKETLAIYQELLSLKFVELFDFPTWHKDVRLYAVYDASDSAELIGHFYLDLFPRDGKYTHAAVYALLKRHGSQVPASCMLANLPLPEGDAPALLTHDDVVTFFHEFGHLMHALCAEGEANNTHLAKCPRDFVEAPSQMLENWCWQPEILARISKHWVTGEPLPSSLLQKLVDAKNVNQALFSLRQVCLASLDLTLHTSADVGDLLELTHRLFTDISLISPPPGSSILRSIGHFMNQYAAQYYGYLWSEVLSADMFYTRFASEGIMNKATGMSYRKQVLAPGGVGSITEHVTKFLGRAPQQDHFLESRGLVQ